MRPRLDAAGGSLEALGIAPILRLVAAELRPAPLAKQETSLPGGESPEKTAAISAKTCIEAA